MDKFDKVTTGVIRAFAVSLLGPATAAFADDVPDYRIGSFGVQSPFSSDTNLQDGVYEQRSEMLFKLSSSMIASNNEDQSESPGSEIRLNRIDFLQPREARMQDIHQGFFYSASVDIDPRDDFQSESRLISSRQLGIHYGRLGSVNYSGVDLSIRQFETEESLLSEDGKDDMWSLGVTTGRKFSLTGLAASDPLWTVSLRGQFNFIEQEDDNLEVGDQQWYLSPGLHWHGDDFMLSADVLMPFMQSGEYEAETDYRIRANIQKRF